MTLSQMAFALACIDTTCWVACFVWMHRISTRQDRLLKELHAQGKRIEELSKVEHDLIREVHPQVGEIKERVEKVADAVNER